jgi:hypothetical protein
LRIVRTKSATAHSILLETTAYFTAPFWFGFGFLMIRADRDGLRNYAIFCDERPITKGANIGLFEQQSTTLRAYLYHWSVLRCGSSSEERRNGSTIAFAQTSAVATSGKCRVSGNPHPAPYFSSCAPQLGYFAQILATGATGATRYRRLRPLGARVRLNSLFKLLSFSGDAERDSLKSLSQVGFTLRGYADFILAGM